MTARAVSVLTNGVPHLVNVSGPAMYADAATTQLVAMPATVTNDTTWYVKTRSARATGFAVTATVIASGSTWTADSGEWVPGTIDCIAHALSLAVSGEDDAATFVPLARQRASDPIPCATRNNNLYLGLNGSISTQTFYIAHIATCDITSLVFGYGNYYGTSAGPHGDGPGDLLINCSALVPSISSTPFRGWFAGVQTGTVKPGAKLRCDPIPVFIPKGTKFYEVVYVSGNWPTGLTLNYAKGIGQDTVGDGLTSDSGEGVASPSGTDTTLTGVKSSSYVVAYSAIEILGTTRNPSVPCAILIGDSVSNYSNEAPDMGWFTRAVNNQYPAMKLSQPGETAQQWAANGTAPNLIELRATLLRYGTTFVYAHGRNDVSGGRTLAQLQGDWITAWTRTAGTNVPQFQATITPKVTSGGLNYTTLGDQTATSNEAVRLTANGYLRDGAPMIAGAAVAVGTVGASRCPVYDQTGTLVTAASGPAGHPLAYGGVLEVADVVESARDSGKWKVDRVRTITDGAMTSGSKTLTSAAQANFQAALTSAGDTGRGCFVAGAAAAGATLAAVIGSVQSATAATHALTASTTVAGATVQIGTATYDGTHPNGDRHRDIATMAGPLLLAAAQSYRG